MVGVGVFDTDGGVTLCGQQTIAAKGFFPPFAPFLVKKTNEEVVEEQEPALCVGL